MPTRTRKSYGDDDNDDHDDHDDIMMDDVGIDPSITNDDNDDDDGHGVPGSSNPKNNVTQLRSNDDPNTCRILLSTDNHLGYAERDSIRGMDSFAAFEEVLYLGQLYNVDIILLAGDVFHDNRPSRRTIYRTMEIVKRYCMGPNPVQIQIISDHSTLQSTLRSSTVNYLDPNYSVHLPIFAIHGNHDDPSRDQGSGELLAALDLFAVTNLINYFGRQEEIDLVQISPILIQKGITRIALYGLGSLRDERLNRMWEKQKVVFLRPEGDNDVDDDDRGNRRLENDDSNDEENNDNCNSTNHNKQNGNDNEDDDQQDQDQKFINIFALHQNRDLGRGTKNCVQESLIPEWMDIVVWGHEHECLIEFFESLVGTFRITQPGSSVATSLVPGEAVQKKIGILDINGKGFKLHPVPLTQVRTFVMTEISLRDHRFHLDPNDPKIDDKLNKLLEEEVQLMIMSAKDKAKEQLTAARAAGNDAADIGNTTLKYKLQRPDEALVRLRVDHVGFATINNQRFGAKFVGKIANPTDILLFHRKKDPKLASVVKKQGLKPMAPEELERVNMEDLVREQLISDGKLNIYGEQDLSIALEEFVDKSGMVSTIADLAADKLSATQKQLIKGKQGDEPLRNDSQILEVLERDNAAKVVVDKPQLPHSASNHPDAPIETTVNAESFKDKSEKAESSVRKRKVTVPQHRVVALDDSDNDDIVENSKTMTRSQPIATSSRPKRTETKSKVAYALDDSDDDEFISDAIVDSDDDINDDDDDEEHAAVTARGRNRKNAAPQKSRKGTARTTKKAAISTAKSSGKRSRLADFYDSDDEVENNRNNFDSADIDTDWGTAKTRTQRSQW